MDQYKMMDVVDEKEFEQLESNRIDDVWMEHSAGNKIVGKLLDRVLTSKNRPYFRIDVLPSMHKPNYPACLVKKEKVQASKGFIVNVNGLTAIDKQLSPLCNSNKKYLVSIEFVEKIKLESGDDFWSVKIGKKELPPDNIPF